MLSGSLTHEPLYPPNPNPPGCPRHQRGFIPHHNPHSLMQRMQEAFELPACFSGGLDSLNDCMRDLGWLPQRKIHIAFCGLADLKQRQPKLFADIADCLALYRNYWHGNPQEHKIVRISIAD